MITTTKLTNMITSMVPTIIQPPRSSPWPSTTISTDRFDRWHDNHQHTRHMTTTMVRITISTVMIIIIATDHFAHYQGRYHGRQPPYRPITVIITMVTINIPDTMIATILTTIISADHCNHYQAWRLTTIRAESLSWSLRSYRTL